MSFQITDYLEKVVFKCISGPEEPRSDRSLGKFQRQTDLFIRESLDVPEDQDLSLLAIEGTDAFLNLCLQLPLFDSLDNRFLLETGPAPIIKISVLIIFLVVIVFYVML